MCIQFYNAVRFRDMWSFDPCGSHPRYPVLRQNVHTVLLRAACFGNFDNWVCVPANHLSGCCVTGGGNRVIWWLGTTLTQKSLATLDGEIVDLEITVKLEMRDVLKVHGGQT